MKGWHNLAFVLVLIAPLLASENDRFYLAPLAPIEREFPMRVSPANQNLYMDGPEALEQEKLRNQEIINSRQFPWIWLIVLISCGGIGWTAFLSRDEWIRYFQKRRESLNPIEQSYAKLRELQQARYGESGNFKAYYGELSAILKEALQQRLQTVVVSLTTEEISNTLEASALLPDSQKSEILKFFAQSDVVIYANQTPTEQEVLQAFQSIESLVNNVNQVSMPPQEGGLK